MTPAATLALLLAWTPFAQAPDWAAVAAEAVATLQGYVRVNTSNPPGDVTKAADFLTGILTREGIEVKRFESAPGRVIVLARLNGDGTGGNVIPSVAEATIDCRLLPGTTEGQWVAEVKRRLADPTITVEVINANDDPAVTPLDTPMYRALESAITRRHPGAIVTPMTVPYGTDANAFRPRGVKSYGIFTGIIPAASVLSMHGDSEFMPVDAMGPAIQILFEALRETASKRK